jgi:Mg-chelatase subunit ChlD
MSITTLAKHLGLDRKTAIRNAAHMALPTRIEMKDDARKSISEIIDELLEEYCSKEIDELPDTDPPASDSALTNGMNDGHAATESYATTLLERLEGIIDLKSAPPADTGWIIAQNYSYIRKQLKDTKLLKTAKKIAIRAIIQRTLQLLGPTRKPMEVVREPYAPGRMGDIEVEMTLEEILGKTELDASDLIIESNVPRKTACVMMLDTSMSMSGDKLGISTASLGVLAFKLKSMQYGVIAFDNLARPLKRLDQRVPIATLVGDMLDITAGGYTNIEDGLRTGMLELNNSNAKERVGVLLTDGNYTAGKDPTGIAAEYPKLFVLMMKSHDSRPDLCARLASLGKGKFVQVDSFDEVPSILRNLLRDFVYRSGPNVVT